MTAYRSMGLSAGLLVGLMLTMSGAGFSSSAGSGPTPLASPSLDLEFYDFFNVPYAEYWGYRQSLYGDLPIGAECFSQATIDAGHCTPSNPAIPDVETFPYTNWYPGVGNPSPTNPNADPWILAPYRIRAQGREIPGYTLATPVYFPVLSPANPAGARLDFRWDMHYITVAEGDALTAAGCYTGGLDGYQLRSIITLTMDLPQSKRMFGVDTASIDAARTWWSRRIDPDCAIRGGAEDSVEAWYRGLGGTSLTVGTYDIYNAFEWFYDIFYTQMEATVADDGTTTVTIDHLAWGTEVLMGRLFYWGSALYRDNYLDSTKAAGWLGMEISWFEDALISGSYGPTSHNFDFSAIANYHFQQLAQPGPNGLYDRVDDVAYWNWGPMLVDYLNDFSPKHLLSELDRLPDTATVIQTTTGHPKYGTPLGYDFAPIAWNLGAGETWSFRFPTDDVVFYDPNLTPLQAHPRDQFVSVRAPLTQLSVKPAGFGTWDDLAKTWTVVGPLSTGGPSGAPGDYAVDVWPDLRLGVGQRVAPALLRATTNPPVHGKIIVDGVARDEWGLAWMKIAPGPHDVTFGDVYGLGPAPAVHIDAVAGVTSEVVGNYARWGSLRVTTEPAVASTISVDGVPQNDWGMWRSIAPGTHTISFGAVAGFNPPADQVVTIAEGEFRHVNGLFTANPDALGPDPSTYGFLWVTTNPAVHSLISVNGAPRDEWGMYVKLAPGDYTVSFKGVYGFTPPAPKTVTVAAGGGTTFYQGDFLQHGSLRITTNPAMAATVFVDGVPRNDWGMWQSMEPGTYTVSFEPVLGMNSPAPQEAVVTAGALTQIEGTYTPVSSSPDAPFGPIADDTPASEPLAAIARSRE